jgi:hypothetical protein
VEGAPAAVMAAAVMAPAVAISAPGMMGLAAAVDRAAEAAEPAADLLSAADLRPVAEPAADLRLWIE